MSAIIKNAHEMWDQAKNLSTSPEKSWGLYSAQEKEGREDSGISVWYKDRLEFYYTVENNTWYHG